MYYDHMSDDHHVVTWMKIDLMHYDFGEDSGQHEAENQVHKLQIIL